MRTRDVGALEELLRSIGWDLDPLGEAAQALGMLSADAPTATLHLPEYEPVLADVRFAVTRAPFLIGRLSSVGRYAPEAVEPWDRAIESIAGIEAIVDDPAERIGSINASIAAATADLRQAAELIRERLRRLGAKKAENPA